MDNLSDIQRAEHIDRYLDGSLDAEETAALEAALDRDAELRQEFEDIEMARTLVRDYALRDEIKSIRNAMRREEAIADETTQQPFAQTPIVKIPPSDAMKRGHVRPLYRRVSAYAGRIAAGVAILLVGFVGYQYATLSHDDLYAEKAMLYQIAASRSAEESTASPAEQLERQYQAQRFDEVITTYEQLSNPSLMAMFLAGNAYLQAGDTDRAIEAFREIVVINGSQGINRFEEDAQYYLALSYLKGDQIDDALPLLEEINADPEHSYHPLVSDYYLWRVKFLNGIQ